MTDNGLWDRSEETTTDADGRYSVAVEPGTYQLLFEPPWAADLATEFWGGVYRFTYAQDPYVPSFDVVDGVPVSGKDVELDANGTISGSIVSTDPSVEATPGAAAYRLVEGEWLWARSGNLETDPDPGHYRIERLPPGTYRVALGGGSSFIAQYWRDASTVESATDVTVAPGAVVEGIDARLDPNGRIIGRVVDASGRGVRDVRVRAEGSDINIGGVFEVEATTNAKGYYLLNALPRARYTIHFSMFRGHCDSAYYHNQTDWQTVDEIVVPAATQTTVTVVAQDQDLDCRIQPVEEPQTFGFDPAFVGRPVGIVPPQWTVPDATISYQWYGLGVGPIPGATKSWYVPTYPYSILHLDVTARREGFEPVRLTFETPVFPGALQSTVKPKVKGLPRLGQTLGVTRGAFNSDKVRFNQYQWLADGQPIRGATAARLTLTRKHIGRRIALRFVAYTTDGAYMPREFTTKATRPVTR